MRLGAVRARPAPTILEFAAQLYALVAQARRISDLAEVVGEDALSEDERRYLSFADFFESRFVQQGKRSSGRLRRRSSAPGTSPRCYPATS